MSAKNKENRHPHAVDVTNAMICHEAYMKR